MFLEWETIVRPSIAPNPGPPAARKPPVVISPSQGETSGRIPGTNQAGNKSGLSEFQDLALKFLVPAGNQNQIDSVRHL